MADAILYGVVQKIIVSLGSSALQHVGSIWGVKGELEKMKDTVLAIQAVLQDAEEQQVRSHQVSDWLTKLREVVFDADDLLSEFSTHVLRQNVMEGSKMTKKVRVFFSSSNQPAFRFKMARKIKAMRERLNDISKDRNDFQLVERPLGTAVVTRKRDQTHSFVREKNVIGREKDKKAIIGQLLDSDVGENVSFISMVGIGGLGKTTLAQYIYNDEKVKAYFELQMWVCVSDHDFDVKTIVENILASATDKKPQNLEMDQLQKKLREKLSQKKYLLVLDDVWNEDKEKWCNLKTLLLDGLKGSKVVITTRTNLVADITSTIESRYFLKGLSNDQSLSLLKQMAFEEKQDTINPNFEAIGREIVEKCCGVPLAIKAIGRVLYYKKPESEWSYIKDNELKNVIKDDIFPVLKLSYDHLPPHLKCCFAYCSLFSKDYLIKKLTLIQLWIAQGFIQSQEENLQLEDIANEYFEDLLWRSFFQLAEEDKGMFMMFKMHDLIHDLAQSISSIECTLINSSAKHVNEKVRHISFPFYNDSFFGENLNSLVKANKIRTFILTYDKLHHQVEVEESTLRKLISAFGYIRALDLHSLKIKTLPNIIGKLMHLKYLDLSWNDIEVLPSSISRLVNLHTLKLECCYKLKELPTDIQKLVSLKHLDICSCSKLTHMPYGIGQLTSLQTLSLFVVSKDPIGSSKHCGGLAELNKLNDLRGEIEITNLELVKDAISETKAANLKEKQHLSNLSLRWNYRPDDVINAGDDENLLDGLQPPPNLKYLFVDWYGGVRFSNWLSSLTNLTELFIDCCNKCQHLPPLYQLPSLRKIYLWGMHSLEYISDLDITNEVSASSLTTFFPSLESLLLEECPNLKGWWKRDIVDDGNATIMTSTSSRSHQYHQHMSLPSFPCLSHLTIGDCSKLTSMPLFPYLEEQLYLKRVSWKALQQTMAMKMNTAGASSLPSSIPPLSKLRKLQLVEMPDKEPLPEEWLQNLTSLEELTIGGCSTSLSQILRHLTSLKKLTIEDCEEVDLFTDADDDGTKFQHVNCLQSLYFSKISKLESLPACLQSVSILQDLSIVKCPSLMTLPEWIGNLTSLQYLEIRDCPNLTSLPEGMRRLTSLQSLCIYECPHLEQRCQKETGEDWAKIAHVPKYSNTWFEDVCIEALI